MNYSKRITDNTLVDYPRLEVIRQAIESRRHIPGDIAEVGVYKGGTARLICETADAERTIWLFDTFKGMPPVDSTKDIHKEGDFSDTSESHVLYNVLPDMPQVIITVPGIFPDSIEGQEYYLLREYAKFAVVHLDVDIYKSTKESLEFFYPRLSPGGVIIIDDYNEPNCPGCLEAVNEFFSGKAVMFMDFTQSQISVIKLT